MAKEKSNTLEIDNFKSTAELTSNPGFQSSLSVVSKSDEKAYNPFEHRNVEHPNTVLGSIIHLLKACLGTGLLAMPAAFKNAGLVVGTIGTILAGLVITHTVHVLVRTAQEICIEAKKPSLSFPETCGAAFSYGPKRFQSWGPSVKVFVDYSLALCYISVLCVYVVFIGASLKEVADTYTPGVELSIQAYCAMTLIPLVLICQIRSLKYLVPFSGVANVCILVVFVITLYYVFTDLPSVSEREMVADISTWPLFFSTVVFAMEGIGVVMPVENEMARPQKFLGCPGVLNVSMVVVICLYGVVGFFGYVQYGDAVKGSITLNLPQDDIVAQSTKLLMAFVILLSFTIQFYVPMEIITRKLKERKTDSYNNIIQVGVRTGIVCFSGNKTAVNDIDENLSWDFRDLEVIIDGDLFRISEMNLNAPDTSNNPWADENIFKVNDQLPLLVGVAAAFPNLELVIGFVGAIFFSTFGLLFPAIVETIYRWDRDLGCMNFILWKNIIIAIIAIIALVSGAYVSTVGMIDEFYRHSEDLVLDDNSTLTL